MAGVLGLATNMTNVVSDITGPVERVLEYPVFPSSKITVASLLALIAESGPWTKPQHRS